MKLYHIQIKLGAKSRLKQIILKFWTEFTQKEYFQSTAEKVIITIEFSLFKLDELQNFSLHRNFSFFVPKFVEKGYLWTSPFNSKYSTYSKYQISSSRDNFGFFGPHLPKESTMVECETLCWLVCEILVCFTYHISNEKKSEGIWISLSTRVAEIIKTEFPGVFLPSRFLKIQIYQNSLKICH